MISCTSEHRAAYGWQRDGGHADYLLAEEDTCVALPDELSYVDGALVACGFGTVYEALNRVQRLRPGSRADHGHGAGGHGGRSARQEDGRHPASSAPIFRRARLDFSRGTRRNRPCRARRRARCAGADSRR